MVFSRALLASLLAAVALAPACSSVPNVADLANKPTPGSYIEMASHNKLLDHHSAVVSGPAGLGLGLGTIIGIPVMILALPVTLTLGITNCSSDPKVSNLEIIGNAIAWPDAACAVGGCYALGYLPYMIVGEDHSRSSRPMTPSSYAPRPVENLDPPEAGPQPQAPASRPSGTRRTGSP